jgi:ABC-2 type transport system permease protein
MAFVLGGTIRGILVGLFTYLATIYFVGYSIEYPLLFVGMVTAASFIFSSCGVIAGLVYENFEKFNFLFTLIITPMTYLGGVFFEASKLPGFAAKLVYMNPLFYIINSIRFGYLGVAEGALWFHSTLTLLLTAISFTAAYMTIKKGIGLTQ